MKNLMKKARAASKGVKKARAASKGDTVRVDFNLAGANGAYVLVTNWKNAALNKAMDKLIEEADATRAMTLDQCHDAAMGMKKGKKGYQLKWRSRASMANKLWKSTDKKMNEKWKKLLMNMPAHQYGKLFPDVYNWVKKFTIRKGEAEKKSMRRRRTTKEILKAQETIGQVCRRMKFRGAPQDFSMWSCLFGDPAFTKVTVEELEALKPYMKTEMKKFRQKHKWWPHPAVLLSIARTKWKQKQEVSRWGTKRKASDRNGDKRSGFKYVFWHVQSECWRAVVKKTSMVKGKPGNKEYAHFDNVKDAVKAVSEGLGIPADKLKKPEVGGHHVIEGKMASLYQGVFYDMRQAYKNKWLAAVYVNKPGSRKKVCKTLGHFSEMLLAAKAVAKALKKKVKDIRKPKKVVYDSRNGKDLAEQRFKILSDVFVNRTVGKKLVPANPPDYEKSEMLMKSPEHKKMFREEPAMEEASIGLKYGPPRDDLLQAWKKTKRSTKFWGSLATKFGFPETQKVYRKLRIIMTLQNVAKRLHKKDCLFWVKNSGRFVSKQQGPAMFLRKHGLVRKVGKTKK